MRCLKSEGRPRYALISGLLRDRRVCTELHRRVVALLPPASDESDHRTKQRNSGEFLGHRDSPSTGWIGPPGPNLHATSCSRSVLRPQSERAGFEQLAHAFHRAPPDLRRPCPLGMGRNPAGNLPSEGSALSNCATGATEKPSNNGTSIESASRRASQNSSATSRSNRGKRGGYLLARSDQATLSDSGLEGQP